MASTLVLFDMHPALTGFRAGDHKRFLASRRARQSVWLSRALTPAGSGGADVLCPGFVALVVLRQTIHSTLHH
jgi:hypothetical protein